MRSTIEDVKLGLDFAQAGNPPLFCPSAQVKSHFPWSIEGARSQRKRWEEGHIRLILKAAPSLLYNAVRKRNLGLLALTLDLVVPPLALLVLLVAGVFFASAVIALFGLPSFALKISAACLVALAVAIFFSWLKHGRDILPLNRIFSVASYIVAKLPLYRQIFSFSTVPHWVRTDRADATGNFTSTCRTVGSGSTRRTPAHRFLSRCTPKLLPQTKTLLGLQIAVLVDILALTSHESTFRVTGFSSN